MALLFAIKSLNVCGGGAERVLVDVVNGLARRGHQVGVLTFDFPGQSFYEIDPSVRRHDLAFNVAGTPTSPMAFLQAIPRIRVAVRDIQPQLLIAFMHSTYVPLMLALSGIGIRLIASEHIDASHYKGRTFQRKLRQVVERQAVCRIVPSESTRRSFLREGNLERIVVPNPVDIQRFFRPGEPNTTPPPIALSVGRFMEQKDHATLLRAFALVANDFPEWRLHLVGDGPLRSALEAQVAELGLKERVEMPGATRDVVAAYAAARFVVLPSLYESYPMVAAESLAAGRAVLGFNDCAGIDQIVTDGATGLLVRGHSDTRLRAESLAQGLRRLMADATLCRQLGSAGPDSIRPNGIDTVLDRWEAVINVALAEPSQIGVEPLLSGDLQEK